MVVACASCKHQRKKCTHECVMAPYFPSEEPHKFENVHRLFGVSNVTKLLKKFNDPRQRQDAVNSLIYEAEAWAKNPVNGCIGIISALQHRLKQTYLELHHTQKQLSMFQEPTMQMGPAREQEELQRFYNQQLINQFLRPHGGFDAEASTSGFNDVQQHQHTLMGMPPGPSRQSQLIIRDQPHHQPQSLLAEPSEC